MFSTPWTLPRIYRVTWQIGPITVYWYRIAFWFCLAVSLGVVFLIWGG